MSATDAYVRPDPALIAELRERIQGIGGRGRRRREAPLSLGIEVVDAALPWGGLPVACLHEVAAADSTAAATGFSAVLLARLAGRTGTVVWCRRPPNVHGPGLYGPGLAALGLETARLIVIRARTDTDVFWAMEEGLRSGVPAAVLGETAAAPPVALRRLQLAAETGGVTALLLRPADTAAAPGPAVTRWRVGSAPALPASGERQSAAAPGAFRWRVELVHHRGVATRAPAAWLLEWSDETGGLAVAAELRHRPAEPAQDAVPVRRAV